FDLAALRSDPAALNRAPACLDIERLDPWFLLRWPRIAWVVARSRRRMRQLTLETAARFQESVVPHLRTIIADERRVRFSQLPVEALVEVFERRRRLVFDQIAPAALLPGMLAAAAWNAFEHDLLTVLGERDGRSLLSRLLGAVPEPTLDRQSKLFKEL